MYDKNEIESCGCRSNFKLPVFVLFVELIKTDI